MRPIMTALALIASIGAANAAETNLAVPAIPAAPAPAASLLPKPIEQSRFVPSGEKRSAGFISLINPDCTSIGSTAYRVQIKPAHGELSFEETKDFTYFASGIREHCNTEKVSGLSIAYQSEADYIGEDKAEVFFIYPNGTAAVVDYTFIVR